MKALHKHFPLIIYSELSLSIDVSTLTGPSRSHCHSPSLPTVLVCDNPGVAWELGYAEQSNAIAEFQLVRPIFVVAPNLIAADKTSRKSPESTVRSVLRCHELCEIACNSAYFDYSGSICRRRRTRWRMAQSEANPSLVWGFPASREKAGKILFLRLPHGRVRAEND
jgi:hypothetical protein